MWARHLEGGAPCLAGCCEGAQVSFTNILHWDGLHSAPRISLGELQLRLHLRSGLPCVSRVTSERPPSPGIDSLL